ncbi:MAG: hypothetical protein Kow00114_11730 [Kiloniellaceae bacterium]
MVMSELSLARVAEAIQQHLARGGDIGRVSAALNHEVKDIALFRDPAEADLPLEELRCVLRYWQRLPKVGGVADILKIDPAALRGALGYLMLVDAGPGENEFRYALYGSKIAAVAGFDMTGKTVWQVATTSAVQTFFAACYRAALALRCPLYTIHKAPPQITASHWHRLILPLGANGEVKRFLVCNTPIQDGRLV